MTELRETSWTLPAANLGPENPLPSFRRPRLDASVAVTDAVPPEDRTYLGWRVAYRVLPYRLQDDYDRAKTTRALKAITLENDKLRATVIPEYGGRLVSLVRKRDERELLDRNPVFQPANLALRNAWFSGGIEWNAGQLGHHCHTCAPVFAARIRGAQGEPALRLYEWDRVKRFPWQVDLHLPPGSDFLWARVRLVNPHADPISMYWWTNIAVPERAGARTMVPADAMLHSTDGTVMDCSAMPNIEGVDCSYAAGLRGANEQFFRIEGTQRPWVALIERDGSGFAQTSTSRLKGRKAFYWGMNNGGRRWQEFLAAPGQAYIEIQAGLARTQIEHLPMPGGASWEWTEAFGALDADAAAVHGADWGRAWRSVDAALERALPRAAVDAMDQKLAACTRAPAEALLHRGAGWAALERKRVAAAKAQDGLPRELDFGECGPDQRPWLELLERGALPEPDVADPGALMTQPEWRALLERALAAGRGDHWASWWHLGNMRLEDAADARGAAEAWEKSLARKRTAWALRNQAVLASRRADPKLASMGRPLPEPTSREAADLLLAAWDAGPKPVSLAIEAAAMLNALGDHAKAHAFCAGLPPAVRGHERIRIQSAHAALKLGKLDEVEALFAGDFATIREGEVTLTDLWFGLHEAKLAQGRPVDAELRKRVRREFPPPSKIDFRVLAELAEAERLAARNG